MCCANATRGMVLHFPDQLTRGRALKIHNPEATRFGSMNYGAWVLALALTHKSTWLLARRDWQ